MCIDVGLGCGLIELDSITIYTQTRTTGGFQEHFFWTAHNDHHGPEQQQSPPQPRKANVTSAEGAGRFEGRRAAWAGTLRRLQEMHAENRWVGRLCLTI